MYYSAAHSPHQRVLGEASLLAVTPKSIHGAVGTWLALLRGYYKYDAKYVSIPSSIHSAFRKISIS